MANRVLAPLFNKPKPATFSTLLIAGHEPLQHKPTHNRPNPKILWRNPISNSVHVSAERFLARSVPYSVYFSPCGVFNFIRSLKHGCSCLFQDLRDCRLSYFAGWDTTKFIFTNLGFSCVFYNAAIEIAISAFSDGSIINFNSYNQMFILFHYVSLEKILHLFDAFPTICKTTTKMPPLSGHQREDARKF